MYILVTGIGGLVGSCVAEAFYKKDYQVIGIENNTRMRLFGQGGNITNNLQSLLQRCNGITVENCDIRDRAAVAAVFKDRDIKAVVHCAGQPSHDYSVKCPEDDFYINTIGTFNLLEEARLSNHRPKFVFLSTNKVYGDYPNTVSIVEDETRYVVNDLQYLNGFHESTPIDQSNHTPFGVNKASADLMVQEYSHCYNMETVCLRCGCITGMAHTGVELHGFLSYLIKCAKTGKIYNVYGYKGKQVRDNICATDLADLIMKIVDRPVKNSVYNVGGGKENSISIIEATKLLKDCFSLDLNYTYVQTARWGDHIAYITDLTKVRLDYPEWSLKKDLKTIFKEIVDAS